MSGRQREESHARIAELLPSSERSSSEEKRSVPDLESGRNYNRVTIRCWKGKKSLKKILCCGRDAKSFGHISLQTYRGGREGKGNYASYWPGAESYCCGLFEKQGCNYPEKDELCSNKNSHMHDLEQDETIENHPPDIEVNLYSLDVDEINTTYELFLATGCDWNIFGSSCCRSKKEHNCSGLVIGLLNKGGIARLVKPNFNLGCLEKTYWIGGSIITLLLFPAAIYTLIDKEVSLSDRISRIFSRSFTFPLYEIMVLLPLGLIASCFRCVKGKNAILTPEGVASIAQKAEQVEKGEESCCSKLCNKLHNCCYDVEQEEKSLRSRGIEQMPFHYGSTTFGNS